MAWIWFNFDTLAAATAESGDFDNAVKRQEQAIEMTEDEDGKHEHKDRLELYKAKKPYRDEPKPVK